MSKTQSSFRLETMADMQKSDSKEEQTRKHQLSLENLILAPKFQTPMKSSKQSSRKKPPMKTALDVINRVKWDDSLNPCDFSVGYLDRFVGVVEKPFSEFDWDSHIADVGPDILAIPQHRIQYFKYRERTVWDKTDRIDHVFGSTAGSLKLQDVLEEQVKLDVENCLNTILEQVVKDPNHTVADRKGTPSATPKISKPKGGANYFIGIKVDDENIRRSVFAYQRNIFKEAEKANVKDSLKEACIPLAKLHLTFCVCQLQTEEDIEKVKMITESVCRTIGPLFANFKSTGNFGKAVIYAQTECRDIYKFVNELRNRLGEAGIDMRGNFDPYNPHLTLVKFGRSNPPSRSITDILSNKTFTRWVFKSQNLKKVVICKIGSTDQTGFYQTIASYILEENHKRYSGQKHNIIEKRRKVNSQKAIENMESKSAQSNKNADINASKALTAILRHNKFGFKVNTEGYVQLEKVLDHQMFSTRFKMSKADIYRIVETNNKKRFEIKTDEFGEDWIKATQGHTVEVSDLDLKEITDPSQFPVVVHGTFQGAWEKIQRSGLHRMKRIHIHMTTAEPSDPNKVVSGVKNGCNVFVHINLEQAIRDGLKFYQSSNGVILSPGDKDGYIRPKFFSSVFGVFKTKRVCLWNNDTHQEITPSCNQESSHQGKT